jgi:hypothetical protein
MLTLFQTPTMISYILSHLEPPEDAVGGIWYNAANGYDTQLVDTITWALHQRVIQMVSAAFGTSGHNLCE